MRRSQGALPGHPTILLVEDEPDVRDSIQDVLQSSVQGARVMPAGSAEEGLAILGESHVDLVLSDYKLPGMDGLRFLKEAHRLAPHAPRFLLTAYADLQVPVATVEAARIAAVVTKPLDAGHLVARVNAALHPAAHRLAPAANGPPAGRAGPPAKGRFVRDA